MQAYGRAFARAYNLRWADFARQVAPHVLQFYADTPTGRENRPVLDLCCGTGQLALHLLERGYPVVGLDLSEAMLEIARENCAAYLAGGQATFVQADAVDFELTQEFGLVTSTFDALNHLPDLAALRRCFACVHRVLLPGGWFVFDLNTRRGLLRWNNVSVDESEEALVVTRGLFDGQSDRAFTRISGFVRVADQSYERFEETVFNTVFDVAAVGDALRQVGYRAVHFARGQDLMTAVPDPESLGRVFVVAGK